MFRRLFRILAILPGIVLASTTLTSPAVAAEPILTATVTDVTLVAKGAAVDIDILYNCVAGAQASGYAALSQRVGGGRLVGGTNFFGFAGELACDGFQHPFTVQIISGGFAFKRGVALLSPGYIFACDASTCTQVNFPETVHVH